MNELILVLLLTLAIFVLVYIWSLLIRNQARKKEIKRLEKYLTDLGQIKRQNNDKINRRG